jgi:hypothetical protein
MKPLCIINTHKNYKKNFITSFYANEKLFSLPLFLEINKYMYIYDDF